MICCASFGERSSARVKLTIAFDESPSFLYTWERRRRWWRHAWTLGAAVAAAAACGAARWAGLGGRCAQTHTSLAPRRGGGKPGSWACVAVWRAALAARASLRQAARRSRRAQATYDAVVGGGHSHTPPVVGGPSRGCARARRAGRAGGGCDGRSVRLAESEVDRALLWRDLDQRGELREGVGVLALRDEHLRLLEARQRVARVDADRAAQVVERLR